MSLPVNAGLSYARIHWLFETSFPPLKILLQPVSESAEESVRCICMHATRPRLLRRDALRIGDQARRDTEGRTVRRFRESADADRPAHANLLVEDQLRELAHARQLARPAGEHDPPARDLVEAA